jgi:hypothetical protein
MSFTSVHPHKGYLNTEFLLHTNSDKPVSYKVYGEANTSVLEGIVYPNEPHSIKVTSPGSFVVRFSDDSSVNLTVVDGYKYGGGSHKCSFIDDTCPWAFIVMRDRCYFYNRITEESYVEVISPDSITYVSNDFVLFSNKGDEIHTLYSLTEQKPVLYLKDVVFKNSQFLIWNEVHNGAKQLVVFSLESKEVTNRIQCDCYVVDNERKYIFYICGKQLHRIDMNESCTSLCLSDIKGTFITFVDAELCVSYDNRSRTELFLYNMCSCENTSLKIDGILSRVNGKEFIDVDKERKGIYQFNLHESQFPNASIDAKYVELYFYPALWDVFYTIKTTKIHKSTSKYNVDQDIYIKALKSNVNHKLIFSTGNTVVTESRFCFYNGCESYVCGKEYSGSGYRRDAQVHVHKDVVYLTHGDYTYRLSRNGYWDNECVVNYDYEYFSMFGVIRDKETGTFKTFSGKEYPKGSYFRDNIHNYLQIGDIRIYSNGKTLPAKFNGISFSGEYKFGIKVPKDYTGKVYGDITLCTFDGASYDERPILQSLFDSSAYNNVLFGNSGEHVMYQSEHDAVVMNIATGQCEKFPNMSYIKHVNGIRLLFETASSLQPRLVNPITKQYINCNSMPDFQFVSPDGKLYADTRLEDYIEYYFKETGILISKDDYNELVKRFTYPYDVSKDHESYVRVVEERKLFIRENFDFLNASYPHDFKNVLTGTNCNGSVLEESSYTFVQRVIGLRGIAVIRYTETDSEVARISLGKPLSYINYVSFSYDSRYIALGGYRDSTHGLFLVYDLETMEIVFQDQRPRAVWTTAFSAQGAVASYSGEPITFFALSPDEYSSCEQLNKRNFLTFSPDGSYLALSDQGYVSKYDRHGNERASWGHQPSTKVIIASVENIKNELYEFNDLADNGISDSPRSSNPVSVASVSFSCDNSKLMMVGEDGVIIIRNLPVREHLIDCIK